MFAIALPCRASARQTEIFLLTESCHDGAIMLRFALCSEVKLAQLHVTFPWLLHVTFPWLQARLPQLRVISVNPQSVQIAILEGDR
ncbi:MAG: 23S rRNA (uracil(747)-C(5))-methyltransferase RlmC [Sodalis sp.]|uniref:hypothetical protein n=1 Tax=Sodalis sp. (in: enterobacteria) TaxID=1898979 RepID=UPI003872C86D|nr:MAG: 23S rRNA (uracil(747)-C(5))-methyltransferase RlmC [Sodalis sp.]